MTEPVDKGAARAKDFEKLSKDVGKLHFYSIVIVEYEDRESFPVNEGPMAYCHGHDTLEEAIMCSEGAQAGVKRHIKEVMDAAKRSGIKPIGKFRHIVICEKRELIEVTI